MSTVTEIEAAIAKLPLEEFRALLHKLNERDAEAWDRQIEEDSASGALDHLLQEVSDDIAQGKTKPLDEVCGDR